jgi:3-deoxy-D-manno-octulosonate 8-phosphate phosphatase (KDO 8-P phosphatase)
MKAAIESGYNVCIISNSETMRVSLRLLIWVLTDIYLASSDKVETFKEYIQVAA